MNVWLAQRFTDYEGSEVLGIFHSPEDAAIRCREDHESSVYPGGPALIFAGVGDGERSARRRDVCWMLTPMTVQ